MSGTKFDREQLCAAFDQIGTSAAANNVRLTIAVYGGSALMLASNFRFATEDVDIAELSDAWPNWLVDACATIAATNGWSADWLNDAVQFHLSPLADEVNDHAEFATFPRGGIAGLTVTVPSLEYMLALKLKALRINDPAKGPQETRDIQNLLRAGNVRGVEDAIQILGKFFPLSAREPDAQRFFLKHIWPSENTHDVTPSYPIRGR